MRVLLVNKFWYRKGGAEQVLFLTKELLEKAGHIVSVFGMQDAQNELQTEYFVEPVSFEKVSLKSISRIIYNREAKNKFKKLIADFKPDVIHFHNIYHQLSFSLIDAGKEAGVNMVMTIHDYHWLSPNYRLFHHGKIDQNLSGGFLSNTFHNPWENFGKSVFGAIEFASRSKNKYKQAISKFIFPSNFAAKLHESIGVKEKSVVIQNPVLEQANAWTEGEYVLYLGRLSGEKGLFSLLKATELLPEIPFVIAGTGPEQKELTKIISNKKLTNVKLVGQVSGAERIKTLQNACVVALPSEWYENAPMSLVEAGVYGKIVLGSKIGGIPEELPGEWLVEPGNANAWAEKIEDWFNRSQAERKKLGEEFAEKILAKHDPEKYLQEITSAYTQITKI